MHLFGVNDPEADLSDGDDDDVDDAAQVGGLPRSCTPSRPRPWRYIILYFMRTLIIIISMMK